MSESQVKLKDIGEHLPALTGLRFFLALWVILHHLTGPGQALEPAFLRLPHGLFTLTRGGYQAVTTFFVLSGFLIYGHLIGRAPPFAAFMWRRVVRIYPAFLVMFVLYVFLSFAFPSRSKLPTDLEPMLIYLGQNLLLLPGVFAITPMIRVAWSLSYEMFFYLVTPISLGLVSMRSWKSVHRISVLTVLAGLLLGLPMEYTRHPRMAMFVAGMLVYEFEYRNGSLPLADAAALGGLTMALGSKFFSIGDGFAGGFRGCGIFLGFLVMSMVLLRAPGPITSAIFTMRWLRWLGNMSYSFYLIHGLALAAFFAAAARVVPSSPGRDWVALVALVPGFAVAWVASTILYVFVERPFSLAAPARGSMRP